MYFKKFTKLAMHEGPEESLVLARKAVSGIQMRPKHEQANYILETLEGAQKFYQALPRKKAALDKGAGR